MQAASTRRVGRAAAFAVLAGIVALTLLEPLLGTRSFLAADSTAFAPFIHHAEEGAAPRAMNHVSHDLLAWLLPEQLADLEAIAAHRVPLWNPCESFGQPRLAMMGYALFYPTALLHLVLEPLRALAVSMALHLVLLGFGTFCVQRRAGLSPLAALLGATAMMLSGYVTAHLQNPVFVRAIAWLPWVHLGFARLVERPSAARAGTLALVVGGSLLAGFPQVALASLYASALAVLPAWRRSARSARLRACVAAAAAVAAGGALASVQLLPSTELLGESWRKDGLGAAVLRAKGLAPQSLAGFLSPHWFGSPVADVDPLTKAAPNPWDFPSYARWQTPEVQNNFEENALYVGLVPLVLAVSMLGRRGLARGATLGLALVLALALAVPLVSDLFWRLPGMSAGNPKRVLFLAAYALAWLAAAGAERIAPRKAGAGVLVVGGALLAAASALVVLPLERWLFPELAPESRAWFRDVVARDFWTALAAGAALLLAGALVAAGRLRVALALLCATTAVDLAAFARHTNPWQPARDPYPTTPVIQWLREHGAASEHRIVSFDDSAVLLPSVAQRFGLRSCQGLGSMLPKRSGELLAVLEPGCIDLGNPVLSKALREPRSLAAPILDLVGARYVVTGGAGYRVLDARAAEVPGLRFVYGGASEAIAVFERAGALPPAFLVEELAVVEDAGERLARMASSDFEPARVALLDEPLRGLPTGGLAGGAVRYARPSPELIELEVETAGPAFLVVTETRLAGWTCELDGAPAEAVAADHAFFGVPLATAGRHVVRLRYAPRSFTAGATLSLAGLALSLGALLTGARRPRRAPSP